MAALASHERIAPDGMLQDKVIIITGASQGIGEVAAFGFAKAGATVVLAARRLDVIEQHAAEIKARGGTAIAIQTDVTKDGDCERMVETAVTTFGRLDGAFNNAGAEQTPGFLCDMSIDEWMLVHDVKIHGTFFSMRHEIPAMIASGGGAIVNQGSVVANRTSPMYPAPASSQAAIVGLTRVAAATYGRNNVRVNFLETGLIITEERMAAVADPARAAVVNAYAPMKRYGTSIENAATAAWLLSDYASYVSGVSVPVDGAHLAGSSPA